MKNFSKIMAAFFGLGYVPKLPGTAGSLGAIPLFFLFTSLDWRLYFLSVAAFTLFAVWVVKMVAEAGDPHWIVIDEVTGLLWALGIMRYAGFWDPSEGTIWLLAIPFGFFRLFDITKWWLVGWAERRLPDAWGIVFDDLFAGIFAGIAGILFCIVYPMIVYLLWK